MMLTMRRSAWFWIVLATGGLLGHWVYAAGPGKPAKVWSGAQWVWDVASASQSDPGGQPRYLRRAFDLTAGVASAELHITVDNHYAAFVNGHKVGEDGEWGSPETLKIAKHLKAGRNVLAIVAKNQGGPAGAIAWLRVVTKDKK